MSIATQTSAPEGYNVLNPYITVSDVPGLIDFLQRVFGGVLQRQITQPDGRIEHAEVSIGPSLLMIGPPEVDALVRTHDGRAPGTFYVYVPDVDATYEAALSCGARAWMPPYDAFYGDRIASVADASGNVWWIATRKEALNATQVQARADRRWHKKFAAK